MNKTLAMLTIVMVLLASCATTRRHSPESDLKNAVASVHKMLQAEQFETAAQTLFGLSDPKEIAQASQHLQRPRCLEMYMKLFERLQSLEPVLHESGLFAGYEFKNFVLSYRTNPKMGVHFYHDGTEWRLNDPSLDRILGRRLITDYGRDIQQGTAQ